MHADVDSNEDDGDVQVQDQEDEQVKFHFESVISDIQELLTRQKMRDKCKENERDIYRLGSENSPSTESGDYSFDDSFDSTSISVRKIESLAKFVQDFRLFFILY